jgi:7-carboxy-7-deazaguanine synthase
MRVAEIFYSIQGEGKLVGIPSVFVRASGCNLRCVWCDTPYTSWSIEGEEMTVDQIVQRVRSFACRHVVFTGGEPVIMPEAEELCRAMKAAGWHVTLETAATVFKKLEIDLASLSPKLSNSTPYQREGGKHAAAHERQRINIDVIQQFIDTSPDFQLKFVVAESGDLDEIGQILERLRGWRAENVLLMPEGTDTATLASRGRWIAQECKQRGFRYCPRLHVELYGNTRGT